ncbi:MAG: glycosyltransferase family 2 protein [Candidatus Electrothrix sp. AW3_4]|nr:glycosyltransferase family 2 protein [Candidatus Electrothrix gigas]
MKYQLVGNFIRPKNYTFFEITVIIPTYRPGKFLFECLASISKQTIDIQNIEVLIILNGDKYPYINIVTEYIQQLPLMNIKFYYIESKGVSNARNLGMEVATAEFIAFIDDDDLISESYLEGFHDVRKDEFMATNLKSFDEEEENKKKLKSDYITHCYKKNYFSPHFNFFKCRQFFSNPVGKIIPKNLIENKKFDLELENGEDSLFMFSISNRVKNIKLSAPDACYLRRIRKDSVSRKEREFSYHFVNAWKLICKYSEVFFKNRKNYSTALYLSRIAATIIKLTRQLAGKFIETTTRSM